LFVYGNNQRFFVHKIHILPTSKRGREGADELDNGSVRPVSLPVVLPTRKTGVTNYRNRRPQPVWLSHHQHHRP